MKNQTLGAYNIADLREIARRRLPKGIFEFVDRGTEDEVGLRNNIAAVDRIKLRPRTLVDVSNRSQEVTLFGRKHKMPIAIAPTGSAGLMWYHGEIALAHAAAAAGIPFTLSTVSTSPLEEVAAEAKGATLWFQIYMWPDRARSYKLVERVKAAGFEALVLTVDSAVGGARGYNLRNGFSIPIAYTWRNVTDVLTHPRWMLGVLAHYVATTGMPRYENYPSENKNVITKLPMGRALLRTDTLTRDDLRMLRKAWPRTLIVKGILHPQDALMAADCGVDGIVVSNHGGRNLDATMAPIEVLPEIVDAVGKRTTIIVDSGFRRGSHVIKALALGANAVYVGRPMLYGAAVGGEAGAARAIELFREEIDRTMALIGCASVAELNRAYLVSTGAPHEFATTSLAREPASRAAEI